MFRSFVVAVTLAAALVVPAHAGAAAYRVCGTTSNGLGILANAKTSCPFARAVGRAATRTDFARVLRVRSPVTGRRITMRRFGCGCSSSSPFGYRGGAGAAVKFQS